MALRGTCKIKGNRKKEYKNLLRELLEGTQLSFRSRR